MFEHEASSLPLYGEDQDDEDYKEPLLFKNMVLLGSFLPLFALLVEVLFVCVGSVPSLGVFDQNRG